MIHSPTPIVTIFQQTGISKATLYNFRNGHRQLEKARWITIEKLASLYDAQQLSKSLTQHKTDSELGFDHFRSALSESIRMPHSELYSPHLLPIFKQSVLELRQAFLMDTTTSVALYNLFLKKIQNKE